MPRLGGELNHLAVNIVLNAHDLLVAEHLMTGAPFLSRVLGVGLGSFDPQLSSLVGTQTQNVIGVSLVIVNIPMEGNRTVEIDNQRRSSDRATSPMLKILQQVLHKVGILLSFGSHSVLTPMRVRPKNQLLTLVRFNHVPRLAFGHAAVHEKLQKLLTCFMLELVLGN